MCVFVQGMAVAMDAGVTVSVSWSSRPKGRQNASMAERGRPMIDATSGRKVLYYFNPIVIPHMEITAIIDGCPHILVSNRT